MSNSSAASSPKPPPGEVILRDLRAPDRPALETILVETQAFTADEVAVAMELIDDGLDGTDPDYRFVVGETAADGVVGYTCFGPTPLTDGVFDLYWIAVTKRRQGRGFGRAIIAGAEAAVRRYGGRLILIETASKASYADTRAFYERTAYDLLARIPDYYAVGDDKLIYGKRV